MVTPRCAPCGIVIPTLVSLRPTRGVVGWSEGAG